MSKKEQAQEVGFRKNAAYKELEILAKEKGKTVREMVMNESADEFNVVVEIFYNDLPKLAKWAMSREKFRTYFLTNRELMLDKAGL